MAKKEKEELFEKETIYSKIIRRVEIRLCLYLDCNDRNRKLIPRPVGITQEKLIDLIALGVTSGILDDEFKKQLKGFIV